MTDLKATCPQKAIWPLIENHTMMYGPKKFTESWQLSYLWIWEKTPISSKDAWPVGNWLWQLFVQMSSALSRKSLIGKGIWESKLIWNVAQSNLRQTMTETTLPQFKKGLQYLSNLFISRKLSFSFPLIVLTNTSSLYYFS